jgi:hypothetical protein
MWRMERAGGLASHLVIAPRPHGALAAWFLNGRPQGLRAFDDVGCAIQFSDRMQHQNWSIGWRLVNEREDLPD